MVFYQLIKSFLLESVAITILSLFFGGIILLILDWTFRNKTAAQSVDKLSLPRLFLIGIFQSLSFVPGVSRSAASIIGGLFAGLNRTKAVEFSFLLAIPTMTAAAGFDIYKSGLAFTPNQFLLLVIGFATSFFTALIVVKTFLGYIAHHNFTLFAIYRIIVALLVLTIFII